MNMIANCEFSGLHMKMKWEKSINNFIRHCNNRVCMWNTYWYCIQRQWRCVRVRLHIHISIFVSLLRIRVMKIIFVSLTSTKILHN